MCIQRSIREQWTERSLISIQPLLGKFAQQHLLTDGLPIYRRLQSDDQDSVRLLTIEDLIAISKRISPAEVKEHLLKQVKQSVGDKSWRVRYMAATHFNEVSRQVAWLHHRNRGLIAV